MAVVLVVLAGAIASHGQVGSSAVQLLHPIMKDPNQRNAPTSLDRDPSLTRDLNMNGTRNRSPYRAATYPAAAQPAQPAQPAAIVARIDSNLTASRLAMIGTVKGLKGTIYVTNVGSREITPVVELAVCDPAGIKIATASKTGDALAPNADERIVVLATNLNAADFKLMRVSGAGAGAR